MQNAIAVLGILMILLAKPLMGALVRALTPAMGEASHAMGTTSTAYSKNPLGFIPVIEKVTPPGLSGVTG